MILNLYKDNIDILAKTIYGMARNDNLKSMEAIACVAVNRYKKSKKKKSFREICMDSQIFSCWKPENYEYFLINNIVDTDPVFATCKRIAQKKLHSVASDITKEATRFHDVFEYPVWARGKSPCLEVELKLFYNDLN